MKHIYICNSAIEGRGINAGEPIKKGEVIQHIKGKPCFLTITSEADSLSNPNWFGIGNNVWIDPDYPNQYLNHSCNPNVGIRGKIIVGKDGKIKGKYEIVALKNIREGKEITVDYSTIEGDALWSMECMCGEKNCRKIIRSIGYLPEKQFKKYLPNVPEYFKKLYLRSKVNHA